MQLHFYNRKRAINQINGCDWNCELTKFLRKKGWLQVPVSKEDSIIENARSLQVIMAASSLLKNTESIEGWMAAATFMKKRNTAPWKKLFRAIEHSNLQRKNVFLGTTTLDHSLFLWAAIFVHLSVIAAACYFSDYKLKGWDPAKIYLFKINSRNTKKKRWNMLKVNNEDSGESFWCLFC